MENNQMKLVLRLVAGGYLIYLAYDLFRNGQESWYLLSAAALFALAGGVLAVLSLMKLVRSDYFRNPPPKDEENTEE